MKKISRFFLISPLIFQTAIWPATRFLLWFFGHLNVRGLENLNSLPKGKGVIFASNHTSELDPIVLPASLPFLSHFMPFFYASRERSFYKISGARQRFYGGLLFKLMGAQPLHSGLKDYERSLVNHIYLLHQGCSLLVFPEGSIQRNGMKSEARGGVAYLSERAESSIVPVAILGAHDTTLLDFFTRKKNIVVEFGTPITPAELQKNGSQAGTLESENVYKKRAQYVLEKIQGMRANANSVIR